MAITYRKDIDGLRALAIVPVVLFHAQVAGFSGGFVGVDVFFVISGFLITSLIQSEVASGQFTYLQFWERRARRLLPPIIVVGAFVLAAGWILLLPDQLREVGQSVVAMGAFLSNVFFWMNTGYFAAPNDSIPLLHTWSLAIEEQYYLLFPMVLVLLAGAAARVRLTVLAVIGVISMGLSVWLVEHYPEAAYYLLPSRAWELMLGGIVGLVFQNGQALSRGAAEACGAIGILMVAVPIAMYTEHTPFPGYAALVPCVGTALIVIAGLQQRSLLYRAFAADWVVAIGKLSYSWYLWHWPVIVYWKVWTQKPIAMFAVGDMLFVVVASLVAAWLSYRYVENPIRRRQFLATRNQVLAGTLGAIGVLAGFGFLIHLQDGFAARLNAPATAAMADLKDWDARQLRCGELTPELVRAGDVCSLGAEDQKPQFVLWGDSHARALHKVFHEAAGEAGVSGLHLSFDACPPLPNVRLVGKSFTNGCADFAEAVLETVEANDIKTVIVAARWSGYPIPQSGLSNRYPDPELDGLDPEALFRVQLAQAAERLAGRNLVFVEEVPYPLHFNPKSFIFSLWKGRDLGAPLGVSIESYRSRNAPVERALEDVDLVARFEPTQVYCEADFCPAVVDDRPLYRDSNHITNRAAEAMRSEIVALLQSLHASES